MGGWRMTELRNGQITDLLSNSMKHNPETIAMGYAILQEKRRIMEMADKTRLMSAIEPLDERTLDYLAVELRTPSYDDSFPIETKRELIAGTLPFYATLGTPAAVDWIIRAIFGSGHIEEWFEYDDDPHHFRAFVGNDGDTITPESLDEFRRAVASVKRLSSWMDSIITNTTMEAAAVYMAADFHETYSKTNLPNLEPDFPGAAFYMVPFMGRGRATTRLPPLQDPRPPELQSAVRMTGHTGSHMRTALPVLEDFDSHIEMTATAQATGYTNSRTRTTLPHLKEETP